MAILTDGPRLEGVDKWTASYLRQIDAAYQHQVLVNTLLVVSALVLLVGAWIVLPRIWRRARAALAGPVRLADPKL